MSFLALHKLVAYLLSGLGLFALTLGYELTPQVMALMWAAFAASFVADGSWIHRPGYGRAWNVALVLFVGVQLARGILIEPTLALALEFAALLQVSRLFNRRTAQDYQQIAVLAFLHLIAATVLSTEVSYALVFIGFVIATPWMLVISHLRREMEANYPEGDGLSPTAERTALSRVLASKRVVSARYLGSTALLSVPLFLLTVVIFLMVPRVGQGFLSFSRKQGERVTGFGDKVELGGFGLIRDDPSVVVRVQPIPKMDVRSRRLTLRLRGTSFDHYDGRRWTRSSRKKRALAANFRGEFPLSRRHRKGDLRLRLVLDHLDQAVVFIPQGAVSLRIDPKFIAAQRVRPKLSVAPGMDIRYPQRDGNGLVYEAFVDPAARQDATTPEFGENLSQYTQIPAGHEAVVQLARQVTAGHETAVAKAKAVLTYLQSRKFSYSLVQPSVGSAEMPLEVFLLRARRGHCEYFSSAMAIMLRAVGVPTRNVTGFLGGRYNAYGDYYALRQGDAHSWVEAYVNGEDGAGWVMYDPTPSGAAELSRGDGLLSDFYAIIDAARVKWMTSVVGYDLRSQISILKDLRKMLSSGPGNASGARTGIQQSGATLKKRAKGIGVTLAAVAVLGLLGFALRTSGRWRRRSGVNQESARAAALYMDLEKVLARSGHGRPASSTPLEHAEHLRQQGFVGVDAVDDVTAAYVAARFGERPISEEKLRTLRRAIDSVKQLPRG